MNNFHIELYAKECNDKDKEKLLCLLKEIYVMKKSLAYMIKKAKTELKKSQRSDAFLMMNY